MRALTLSLAILVLVLSAHGCATGRSDRERQRQAALNEQREAIVSRLIPEDGLTFTRRTRLIDATIAVLGRGDREELQNVNQLRNTLRAASLPNLHKIEASYKERLAEGQ